jgi:D-glycero-D-manno-heptose 1,7-bisphosphate phosphatase
MVTNQPDIARGLVTAESVEAINGALKAQLGLDDIYVCLHMDEDQCDCRKPKPGLLIEAARRWNIDLRRSFMVGDRWRDIEAGRAAGCRTVFIDHDYAAERPPDRPDLVATSLAAITPELIASRALLP